MLTLHLKNVFICTPSNNLCCYPVLSHMAVRPNVSSRDSKWRILHCYTRDGAQSIGIKMKSSCQGCAMRQKFKLNIQYNSVNNLYKYFIRI